MNETDSRVRLYDADTHGHPARSTPDSFLASPCPRSQYDGVGTTYFARAVTAIASMSWSSRT